MQSLKQEFVTLYWLESWDGQYRRKFLESLDNESILALITARPTLKETVLTDLTERTRTIVSDDLE